MGKIRAELTFIGEANRVPEIGDRLILRVADGSWRSGFRCVGGEIDGHVLVNTEEGYQQAKRAGKQIPGDPWPIEQLAVAEE